MDSLARNQKPCLPYQPTRGKKGLMGWDRVDNTLSQFPEKAKLYKHSGIFSARLIIPSVLLKALGVN